MLKKTQKITLEGRSVIDGVEVAGFTATINSEDPNQMRFSSWQINAAMYKENRVAARADEAEFEDFAYTVQDTMIAEMATSTETETVVQ